MAGSLALFVGLFPLRVYYVSYGVSLLETVREHIVYLLFCDLSCFAMAAGLRYLYRLPHFQKPGDLRMAFEIVAISATLAIVNLLVTFPVFDLSERFEHHPAPHLYLAASLWPRFWFFSIWSLLYFLIRGFLEARQMQRDLRTADVRRRDAELLMLRAQMNPHFLFNALNTMLGESDGNPRLALVVRGVSDYMRYALANRRNLFVPLADEAEALERYADVERVRFGDELEIVISIDPRTHNLPVPGVFMQPLVENAIKHGRETSQRPMRIRVETRFEDNLLVIRVSNTGRWNPEGAVEGHPSGAGLDILRRQLELLYPGRSCLDVGEKDSLVVAEITLRDPVAAAREARANLEPLENEVANADR